MTIISNLYEFLYNFLGVGFSSAVAMFLSCCYYPIILTWAFFYLTQSFRDPLPWENCGNWWNNETTCVANFTGIANASNYTTAVREYWESVTNNSNIFSSYKREFFLQTQSPADYRRNRQSGRNAVGTCRMPVCRLDRLLLYYFPRN